MTKKVIVIGNKPHGITAALEALKYESMNKEQSSKEILHTEERPMLVGHIKALRAESKIIDNHTDPQSYDECWDYLSDYAQKAINALEASEAHAEELKKELDRVKEYAECKYSIAKQHYNDPNYTIKRAKYHEGQCDAYQDVLIYLTQTKQQ